MLTADVICEQSRIVFDFLVVVTNDETAKVFKQFYKENYHFYSQFDVGTLNNLKIRGKKS